MTRGCIVVFFATMLVVGGCSNNEGAPRIGGSGGSGGIGGSGGAGGSGGFMCNCSVGEECADDGTCISICGQGTPACVNGSNASCCPSGFVCDEGSCERDCGVGVECNGLCCDLGQMCFNDQCVAQCLSPGQLCGIESQLCCPDGDACIGEACVTPGPDCVFSEECEIDEICEPSLGKCIPRDAIPECIFVPPVGEFSPVIGCRWTPPPAGPGASPEEIEIAGMAEVVMTPAVANMTDDNDDGFTDTRDTPDIVFISFDYTATNCCTPHAVIRVVSGACNMDGTMNTLATLKGDPRPGGIDPDGFIGNSSGVALGNVHPDSGHPGYVEGTENPEIVANFYGGGTIAFRRTAADGTAWEIMWQNDDAPTRDHTWQGGAQPQIADLDADGQPEVIVGNVVLDGLTGAELGDGLVTATSPNPGIGNNAFLGPVSTVADFNLDGEQEIMAGNTMYAFDRNAVGDMLTELWTYDYETAFSSCQGRLDCDGFNGAGNFDLDDEGEAVIIRLGELFVLNHDGTEVSGIPAPIKIPGFNPGPPSYSTETPPFVFGMYTPPGPAFDANGNALLLETVGCGSPSIREPLYDEMGNPILESVDDGMGGTADGHVQALVGGRNESGPPTVADFDGDGFAEIGTASSTAYVVIDFQCTDSPLQGESQLADCQREWIRWMVENDDCSSRATGSSVFDFEGDGSAEVVYADETSFRIFSGIDGTELYRDDTHSSNTRLEMPIVVDVDNDGKSEVIIPEPNRLNDDLGGIEVWEDTDNNWVRTRRIWNQHAYSVTNITEDAQVPRSPEPNWLNSRLNNFRQNVQPDGLFDAPDFVVRDIIRDSCSPTQIVVTMTVGNDGALSVPPGILTHVVASCQSGTMVDLGTFATQEWLLPGQSEDIDVIFSLPPACPADQDVFFAANTDDDGMGNGQYNECFDDNNGFVSNPISCSDVE